MIGRSYVLVDSDWHRVPAGHAERRRQKHTRICDAAVIFVSVQKGKGRWAERGAAPSQSQEHVRGVPGSLDGVFLLAEDAVPWERAVPAHRPPAPPPDGRGL